jgi:putative heme transporter
MSRPQPSEHPAPGEVTPFPRLTRVGRASWSVVGVAAAGLVLLVVLDRVRPVLVPVLIGLLLAALLHPLAVWLRRAMPAYLASAATMLTFVGVIVLASWVTGAQMREGVVALVTALPDFIAEVQSWLEDRGLGIGGDQAESALQQAQDWVRDNSGTLADQIFALGSSAAGLLTGTLIALVTAFFFLADGRSMWDWVLRLTPRGLRERTDRTGAASWVALQAYIRTQTVVAAADAVGIGLGAWALGLPYVGPLMLITFLAAFVPIVGAVASGALAVVIALGSEGLVPALIMLAVVVVVQQLESNVLQPVLMGRAVDLHPWAVIVGVALGSFLLGIVGAVLAVPFMAVVNTGAKAWVGDPEAPVPPDEDTEEDQGPPPDDGGSPRGDASPGDPPGTPRDAGSERSDG